MTSSKPVRLLTPDEAAQFLSVSHRTVKRLVAEGSLRACKVRRSMRFVSFCPPLNRRVLECASNSANLYIVILTYPYKRAAVFDPYTK